MVVSDIIFKDENKKPISIVRDIYFYSKDNYAAVYSSAPIRYTQKNNICFIDEVELLFKSMDINW